GDRGAGGRARKGARSESADELTGGAAGRVQQRRRMRVDQALSSDGQRRPPVEGQLRVKSCNSRNKRISAARYPCRSCFDAEAEGIFSRFRARQFHGLTLFKATRLP